METFQKLRPDQDLQVYFEQPSAIAGLSESTATSFKLSGEWRQQSDWCVVEWTRDNPVDHPLWRNFPDGDLSGITLQYDEHRSNCILMDSALFPTVEWDQLRVWTEHKGISRFHRVRLLPYAQILAGSYQPATCTFTLTGTPATGDYIGLSWHTEHRTHQAYANETPETIVQALADGFNGFPGGIEATANGNTLELRYAGIPSTPGYRHPGANGNRVGVYSYVKGTGTLVWDQPSAVMSGGSSPDRWRVTLPFASLLDENGDPIDWQHVRKLRWTYAAPVSYAAFERLEFVVTVENWTVSGTGIGYRFAGPGSRRIEDSDPAVQYSGLWSHGKGNYSGGSIHWTSDANAEIVIRYFHPQAHELYMGSRALAVGGDASITINGGAPQMERYAVPAEDNLVRRFLQSMPAGNHEVRIRKASDSSTFYFDYVEIAHPETVFPAVPRDFQLSLSTDWDTDHSLSIPAERTAAFVRRLGYCGRVNHYVGAMWFYQLRNKGFTNAETTVVFEGEPAFGSTTELRIGNQDYGPEFDTVFTHLNRVGDSAETIATAFALRINDGSTAIRAEANSGELRILARRLGTEGNKITVAVTPASGTFYATPSTTNLAGGENGAWVTDINATPKLNRAMRDWHRAFFAALAQENIDCVSAYSTELRHADRSVSEGIAQRYWDLSAVELNTPALQTNFSPTSLAFWREIHEETAQLMAEGGLVPYLQLGEVQYWYFPNPSGMPYYDEDATAAFQAQFGRPMARILNQYQDPAAFADETEFLRNRLGAFSEGIFSYVRGLHPAVRFEVLYPPDVNDSPIGQAVNYPDGAWSTANLDCLKTESFIFTLTSNLIKSKQTIAVSAGKGFPPSRRAHLVGISDYSSSWRKELDFALDEGLESVTLFALDQFCLVGYPLYNRPRRMRIGYFG
ncbi:MAG: hypothetical protein U5J83_03310 [Bryobacterales bacterium]|nr:hypothetical protein [Bryobacterales bacterium]